MREFRQNLRTAGFWLARILNYPLVCPDVIQIPMTERCNLRCRMCSVPSDFSLQKRELLKEEIFDILRQAGAMGIKEAVLTGGEPLLRADFFDICAESRRLGVRSIATTNGTLIDPSMAEKLISCGVSHLHFSLDGLKGSHDSMRGEGSFERTAEAIKTIDALRKKNGGGPSIGIACVIMESNIEDLFLLLRYADEINVDVVTFLPLLKNNVRTPDREESAFWPRPDQMDALDREIEKIKNFKGRHSIVYEEPDLRLLGKYYRQTLSVTDWKCFTGYKTVFICLGDDGAPLVYTCHGICGDISKKSLKDCWLSPDAMKLRKQGKICAQPCLQSCYSRVVSDSLKGMFKKFFKEFYGK